MELDRRPGLLGLSATRARRYPTKSVKRSVKLRTFGGELSASPTSDLLWRALSAVGDLAELRTLEDFPRCATEMLSELIPCDHCGYNAIDLDTGQAVVVANPALPRCLPPQLA